MNPKSLTRRQKWISRILYNQIPDNIVVLCDSDVNLGTGFGFHDEISFRYKTD